MHHNNIMFMVMAWIGIYCWSDDDDEKIIKYELIVFGSIRIVFLQMTNKNLKEKKNNWYLCVVHKCHWLYKTPFFDILSV